MIPIIHSTPRILGLACYNLFFKLAAYFTCLRKRNIPHRAVLFCFHRNIIGQYKAVVFTVPQFLAIHRRARQTLNIIIKVTNFFGMRQVELASYHFKRHHIQDICIAKLNAKLTANSKHRFARLTRKDFIKIDNVDAILPIIRKVLHVYPPLRGLPNDLVYNA